MTDPNIIDVPDETQTVTATTEESDVEQHIGAESDDSWLGDAEPATEVTP